MQRIEGQMNRRGGSTRDRGRERKKQRAARESSGTLFRVRIKQPIGERGPRARATVPEHRHVRMLLSFVTGEKQTVVAATSTRLCSRAWRDFARLVPLAARTFVEPSLLLAVTAALTGACKVRGVFAAQSEAYSRTIRPRQKSKRDSRKKFCTFVCGCVRSRFRARARARAPRRESPVAAAS